MNTEVHCYPQSIIRLAVYFKVRFTLSYRDIEEIIKIRAVIVVYARIQHCAYADLNARNSYFRTFRDLCFAVEKIKFFSF
jgi:transposase-like protein